MTTYRVIVIDANTIQLSLDGTNPVDLRSLRIGAADIRLQIQAQPVASVDLAANSLTVTGHQVRNGDTVRVRSDGTLPGGVAAETDYIAIVDSSGNIQLSPDGEALVDITSTGTGSIAVEYASTTEALFPPYLQMTSAGGMAGLMGQSVHRDYALNDSHVVSSQAMLGAMANREAIEPASGGMAGVMGQSSIVLSSSAMAAAMGNSAHSDGTTPSLTWRTLTDAQWRNLTDAQWLNLPD